MSGIGHSTAVRRGTGRADEGGGVVRGTGAEAAAPDVDLPTVPGDAGPVAAALRARLALTATAVRSATALMWRADGLGPRYVEYLAVMHGVIRASVPLMERAAARCAELGPDDPVAGRLEGYFRAHALEERDHDDWLLDDLTALGADATAVTDRQPSPAVARFVGAQYYWVEHHHPVALLGHIAVLESHAPAPWLADRIAAAGVPEAALRTVREHAALDGEHTAALFALLDTLDLDPGLRSAVTTSAVHTVDGLTGLFARLGRTPLACHSNPGGRNQP